MAPTRKHKGANMFKSPTSTYVHPSLGSSAPASSQPSESPTTVNEQISYLRRVQRVQVPVAEIGLSQLQIGTPPRPTAAGPPPPRSWARGDVSGWSGDQASDIQAQPSQMQRPRRSDYFPGANFPSRSSLLNQAMKSLARDIDWHVEYDHTYLSMLPVELKGLLLSYIARHSQWNGISAAGFKILFLTAEESGLADSTGGADEVDRLDLGVSIGRGISMLQLEKFLVHRHKTKSDDPPDSWDSDASISVASPSPLHFQNLTKLSLANPGKDVSWSSLLSLSLYLGRLTHLSLAGWPAPSFPSSAESPLQRGPPSQQCSDEDLDDNLDEADFILRRLSRNTPSLTYLSLADWHPRFQFLMYSPKPNTILARHRALHPRRPDVSFSDEDENRTPPNDALHEQIFGSSLWKVVWRHLRTLDLHQSAPLPPAANTEYMRGLFEQRREWHDASTAETHSVEDASTGPRIERTWGSTVPFREAERYVLRGTEKVLEDVRVRERRGRWMSWEARALQCGRWVNAQRLGSGMRMVKVVYGWGPEELREKGYSEEDVGRITGKGEPRRV